jgi:hypothetical protein
VEELMKKEIRFEQTLHKHDTTVLTLMITIRTDKPLLLPDYGKRVKADCGNDWLKP